MERVPDFAPYSPSTREALTGDPAEMAFQLASQLNLAPGRVLYMLQI